MNILIYIIIPVFLLFFLLFVAPHTIKIKVKYKYNKYIGIINEQDYVVFKAFKIIPIYKMFVTEKLNNIVNNKSYVDILYNLTYQINKQKKNRLKRPLSLDNMLFYLFKNMVYRKFVFYFGFNTNQYILNSYINATINTILCMYINVNQEKFNFKQLYYQVYISKFSLKIYLDSIININFAKTIIDMLNEHINRKVLKKRSDDYGRTSY